MKQSVIHLEEGKYTVGVRTLQKDTDEPSAMASYLSQTAVVTNQDGVIYLSVMFQEQQIVTGFQVENEAGELIEAIEKQINEETATRYEMFELAQLAEVLPVRVQYEVEYEGQTIKGDEALRLAFDEESLDRVE